MDDTIVAVLKGAAILAAVAMLIAILATYWWLWIGLGIAGFFGLKFYNKKKDEGNKV